MAYATVEQLTTYLTATGQTVPDGASGLLDRASRLVDRALISAVYKVDDQGNPTDSGKLQAVQDATCEQVSSWITAGVDPAGAGLVAKSAIASKSLDGASVSYDNSLSASVAAMKSRQRASAVLCDQSMLILQQAGFSVTGAWIG